MDMSFVESQDPGVTIGAIRVFDRPARRPRDRKPIRFRRECPPSSAGPPYLRLSFRSGRLATPIVKAEICQPFPTRAG